jgi:hypothetical protein
LAWRTYFADFMEAIKAAHPNKKRIANAIWYSGPGDHTNWTDAQITRALRAATHINIERGACDAGITGSVVEWTYTQLQMFQFIEYVHSLGVGTVLDGQCATNALKEYNLAAFFLTLSDYTKDHVGDPSQTPDNWWAGYDVKLGNPLGARTTPLTGLYRRAFTSGLVYLNEPEATTRVIPLDRAYRRIDGTFVSSITLAAKEAAILMSP